MVKLLEARGTEAATALILGGVACVVAAVQLWNSMRVPSLGVATLGLALLVMGIAALVVLRLRGMEADGSSDPAPVQLATAVERSSGLVAGIFQNYGAVQIAPMTIGGADSGDDGIERRIEDLAHENFRVCRNRVDTIESGSVLLLRYAPRLSANGLAPRLLDWPWDGDIFWDELERFCSRLCIIGFADVKRHVHTWQRSGDQEWVSTYFLSTDGSRAVRWLDCRQLLRA